MTAVDLLSDSFPHGTKEGYEQGCRGGWCPSKNAGGDSCVQASIRYRGDWEYRKAVDAGLPLPAPVLDRPKGSATKRITQEVIPAPTVHVPLFEPATTKAGPIPVNGHGTRAMWLRGCRVDAGCRSFIEGGISCREAANAYKRDRAARLRGEAA